MCCCRECSSVPIPDLQPEHAPGAAPQCRDAGAGMEQGRALSRRHRPWGRQEHIPGLPHPAELSLAPLLAQGEPSSHRDHLWDAAPRGCECCCRPRQPPARAWPHTAPEHLQKGWSSTAQSSQQRRGEKSPNKWQLPESMRENATGITSAG